MKHAKGTCIFHGPVSALYHRHPPESGCLRERVGGEKEALLDVFVFVCERDREL